MGIDETPMDSTDLKVEDLENLKYALNVVTNYTNFLFQRAWGTVFLAWGVLFPVTIFLFMKAEEISDLLGLGSPYAVSGFGGFLSLLVPVVTIYSFGTATRLIARKEKMSFRKDAPHVIAVCLAYLAAFFLAGTAFEEFGIVVYLPAIGAANLVAYFVVGHAHGRRQPEILLSGASLLIVSIPIVIITDVATKQWLSLLAFGACFILAGTYGRVIATRSLGERTR